MWDWSQFSNHGYNSWSLVWNFVQHGELLNDDYATEGISLTRIIKTSSNLQCSLCKAAPSPQKKKKDGKSWQLDRSFERGKKKLKSILFIFIYLFIYYNLTAYVILAVDKQWRNACIKSRTCLYKPLYFFPVPDSLVLPVKSSVWLYSIRKPRACQKLWIGAGVGKGPAPGQRKIANALQLPWV